ncbi:MAG: hypothetical protein U9Q82_01365 [Chloroflexota bacterium]|nr:hypothetical protein [Chloroflexota bacterium]
MHISVLSKFRRSLDTETLIGDNLSLPTFFNPSATGGKLKISPSAAGGVGGGE